MDRESQLKQAIRDNIRELECLVREAGYNVISDGLRSILKSTDQCLSLYKIFSRKPRQRKESDSLSLGRYSWFKLYTSPGGGTLSDEQVESLTRITARWELNAEEIRDLKICLLLWKVVPRIFCDGETADSDLIRRCYNDLERMRVVDPTRRKVLLMTLSDTVEKEQQCLNTERRKRNRSRRLREMDTRDYIRNPVFLTSALRTLSRNLWPDLNEQELKRRRKLLSENSLSGWKWRQLKYPEIVLSLHNSAAKKFERHKWKAIEIQAIDAYVEKLPQFDIRKDLLMTWNSIAQCYHGEQPLTQSPPLTVQCTYSANMNNEAAIFATQLSPEMVLDQPGSGASTPSPGDTRHAQDALAVSGGRSEPSSARYSQTPVSMTQKESALESSQLTLVTEGRPYPSRQSSGVSSTLPSGSRVEGNHVQGSQLYTAHPQLLGNSGLERSDAGSLVGAPLPEPKRSRKRSRDEATVTRGRVPPQNRDAPTSKRRTETRFNVNNVAISHNARENHVNATVPVASYNPGLFDTSYACPSTPYRPVHNANDTNIGQLVQEHHANATVPVASYNPGLFDTSYACPSTPYRPVHNANDTNIDQLVQEHHANAMVPVASYNPGLFDTRYACPSTPYQPVHNTGETSDLSVLPLEPFNSSLTARQNCYHPGLFNTSCNVHRPLTNQAL